MRAEWDASDGREQRFLRPESREVRRRRRPFGLRELGRGALGTAVLLALGGGAVAGKDALLTSERLAVRKVTFDGERRTSPAFLAEVRQSLVGRNVLALDLGSVEERLRHDGPWIKSATVRRTLPDRIDILLAEDEAVARLSNGHELVTASGGLVPALPASDDDGLLPLVACAPSGAPAPETLTHLVELVSFLESGSSPLAPRTAVIDANDPEDLVLRLVDVPWVVHLGTGARDEIVSRLNRFMNVEPVLRARYTGIETVDLRFRDRVVVAPVEPSPQPSSPVGG